MKNLNLKNKFIMAPVKLGYSDGNGVITNKHLDFYKTRLASLGALTPEPLYMHKTIREIPTQLGIDDDSKIKGLKKLSELARQKDTKLIAHLNHPGRMANPKIPGNVFLSSTDKPCEAGGAKPEKMTEEMMQEVIQLFIKSSKRAEAAGFDIIEIQFGHGYLMAQFLSPAVNDREDEYGGSQENRMKFPLELAGALREAVTLPLIARISGDEMNPAGFHIEDMITFSKELEKIGFDAIHVSTGTVCSTPPWYFQHMFVPKGKSWELAAKIKEKINLPVIFVGQINTREDVQHLENDLAADYLAIGRALVADPDFTAKCLNENSSAIRPCLSCSDGCLGGVKQGKGLGCLVNPQVNTSLPVLKKAEKTKNIAIVGAGLAGMQAALTLQERGHKVSLFEKEKEGGQFALAALPPKKQSLQKLIEYYKKRLEEQNIKPVQKNINVENLPEDFDEIILASGSVNIIPPLEGLKDYQTADILSNLPSGKNALVIGGGLIGLEVAHALDKKQNKVTVVEMLEETARGMEMIEKKLTLKSLKEDGVAIYTKTKVARIDKDKVYLEGDTNKILEGIDLIVIATGMKSSVPFHEENLKKKIPLHLVGDAKKVAKAQDAIHDAYELALNL